MANEPLPDAAPEEAAAPVAAGASGPPKLKLAPRGSTAPSGGTGTGAPAAAKSNPFGAAKPREDTLKAKGVDVVAEEAKVEAKLMAAKPLRFTKAQQEEVDALQVKQLHQKKKKTHTHTHKTGRAILARSRHRGMGGILLLRNS
jgi:hypothetical protein